MGRGTNKAVAKREASTSKPVRLAAPRPMPAIDPAPIWWVLAVWAVIAVAVLGVYWQTRGNEFVTFDDRKYIYENPLVTGNGGLSAIWKDLWNPAPKLHYYPLTFSTFWVEHKLVGLTPPNVDKAQVLEQPAHPLYHFTQMLLQAINAGLVLIALRALGVSFPVAAFTAAFFAIHPVNAATVAWMAERKNLVSGVFLWTTLILYIYHRRRTATPARGHGPWLYLASILTFALALCGKAASLVLAPVLVVTDRVLDGRWSGKSVLRAAPFFVMGAIMAGITASRERSIAKSWEPVDVICRPFIAVSALVHYVAKMLIPIRQALIYPRWPEAVLVPRYWISLAVVAAAAYLIWRYRKRLGDHWLWGLGLFLLTVAPVIGLKNFLWMEYSFVSDHYMYYGSSGVILMVGLLLEKWCRSAASPDSENPASARAGFNTQKLAIVGVLSLAALVACGWRTVQQGATWKNNYTLWTHTIAVSPDCMVAHLNLGNLYTRQGRYELAYEQYKEEARSKPTYSLAWQACAVAAQRLNRPEDAIAHYRQAVKAVEAKNPRAWSIQTEYADYLSRLGRRQEALAEYESLLRKRPPNAAHVQTMLRRLRGAPEVKSGSLPQTAPARGAYAP